MKKFLVVLALSVCGGGAIADCNWVQWKPGRDASHDDYIWKNAREYNDAKVKDGESWAAICGGVKTGTCSNGDTIVAPIDHVFKENTETSRITYVCRAGLHLNHHWEPLVENTQCSFRFEGSNVTLAKGQKFPSNSEQTMTHEECSKITGEKLSNTKTYKILCNESLKLTCVPQNNPTPEDTCSAKIKGQNVTIKRGTEYGVDLTAEECKSAIPAAHGASYDNNAIYHFYCGPICKNVGCKKDYHKEGGQCVKNKVNPPKPGKTCRDQYAKDGNARLACCDVEDAGLGEWNNGKCNCYDDKNFEIVNVNHGQCIPKQQNIIPETKCPNDANPVGKTCVCNDNNMTYNAGKNSCECPSGTIKTGGVCKCPDPNKELVNGKCEYGDAHWSVQIDGYYSQLHGIIDGLKLNVWRDAEGNFNTARLASDSIAGVVLGTVGGVVTAHLVKKNQLKKGFEDIQCHIGGQSVADYGDGFVVGR